MKPTIKIERSKKNGKWYARMIGRNGSDVTWMSAGGKQRGYVRRSECVKRVKQAQKDFAEARIKLYNSNGTFVSI